MNIKELISKLWRKKKEDISDLEVNVDEVMQFVKEYIELYGILIAERNGNDFTTSIKCRKAILDLKFFCNYEGKFYSYQVSCKECNIIDYEADAIKAQGDLTILYLQNRHPQYAEIILA